MKKLLPIALIHLLNCQPPDSPNETILCAETPITKRTTELCQTYRHLTIIALGGIKEEEQEVTVETAHFLEIDCSMPPEKIQTEIQTNLNLSTAELCIIQPPP